MPVSTPLTTPELLPIVAMPELLLLHVPPPCVVLSEIVDPAHTAGGDVIAGIGLTITVCDTAQAFVDDV